jgi:hypothetical protein
MNGSFRRLLGLAFAAWGIRVAGPDGYGVWALGTNLLAAVTIQAGLRLEAWPMGFWIFGVGLFWDATTFSALGHHALVMGLIALTVRTQRGWWMVASAGEQIAGAILASVAFFVLDRFLHELEVRSWAWPFSLSVALVLAGGVNGLVSWAMGTWLGRKPAQVRNYRTGGGR